MNIYNQIVFGPVPSRRLGKSIGINNIPPKYCSYSCIYCQLGVTKQMGTTRKIFFDFEKIIQRTKQKIEQLENKGEQIDYITIVSDGEPTLDVQLGMLIQKLKKFSYPVAVITNSSIINEKDVRTDLEQADLVSVKIDAMTDAIWKKIDRPYKKISLKNVLGGIQQFSDQFKGILFTETMLVNKVNDTFDEIKKIATFIEKINVSKSYLSIPTRPPTESWVKPTTEKIIMQAYELFTSRNIPTEFLIDYEGNDFVYSTNAKQDLLSILSVHPMRKDAIETFLKKANESYDLIDSLLKNNEIVKHKLNNHIYFSRKLP